MTDREHHLVHLHAGIIGQRQPDSIITIASKLNLISPAETGIANVPPAAAENILLMR